MTEQSQPQTTLFEAPISAGPVRSWGSILGRRIWIIVLVTAGVFLSACIMAIIQPKTYRSTALILVTPIKGSISKDAFMTPIDLWAQTQSQMTTHLRMIRRLDMASKVSEKLELDVAYSELIGGLSCATVQDNVLAVNYDDTNPKRAQKIVNEWASAYIEDAQERGSASTRRAINYCQQQLDEVQRELNSTESALAEGPVDGGAARREEDAKNGDKTRYMMSWSDFSTLREALIDNRLRQVALEAQIKQVKKLVAAEPPEIDTVESQASTLVRQLQSELAQLRIERQKLKEIYKPETYEVQTIDRQIKRLEEQLSSAGGLTDSVVTATPNPSYTALRDEMLSIQSELRALKAAETALEEQVKEQETHLSSSVQLQRRQSALDQIHAILVTRLYELRIQEHLTVANLEIIQIAESPGRLVKPRVVTLAGLGLFIGLLIALTLALVIDQVEDTFADIEEARAYTGLRLLGAIPQYENGQDPGLVLIDTPRAAFSNAVRMLASTLRIEMNRRGEKSLAVTSAGRGEGKTIISANLAAAFGGAGAKVLLVDADLHKPNVHRYFGIEHDRGFANVLMGEMALADVIVPTQVPGVSVLPSGPLPPSPADLLAGDMGSQVMQQINDAADIVIWDTPPAAFLPDAMIIGGQVDEVLFVAGKQARRRVVRQTLANLHDTGLRILGLAANQVRPGGSYYYYYYYYYHQYYYSDDEKQSADEASDYASED